MDDILDAIQELFTYDPGSTAEVVAKKTGRILYGALTGAVTKGQGVIIWSAKGIDFLLDRAGVPEDTVLRGTIRAELADYARTGGFGVRVLDPETDSATGGGFIFDAPRNPSVPGQDDILARRFDP